MLMGVPDTLCWKPTIGEEPLRCLRQKAWECALVVSAQGAGEGTGRKGNKGRVAQKLRRELPKEEETGKKQGCSSEATTGLLGGLQCKGGWGTGG